MGMKANRQAARLVNSAARPQAWADINRVDEGPPGPAILQITNNQRGKTP